MRLLLRHDERAFEEFFADYFPRIFRFALTRLDQDLDAAEEVTQTTLIRVISKLETYRGEATLFSWMCTFCRHEISAYYRKRKRSPATVGLVEDPSVVRDALESLAAEAEGPEARVHRSDVRRLVHATLDQLPSHYADALELKYIQGESVKEVARRLQVTAKAAESLLTRARAAFRESFASAASDVSRSVDAKG